jgi:4-hydroxy-4-methyl-2-oxoglutarate aldolase
MNEQPRRLTGRLARHQIVTLTLTRVPAALLARYRALDDLTSTVSDTMDMMGVNGVIPASILRPSISGARMVGQAITLRNALVATTAPGMRHAGASRLADIECHNLAEPGDVLVIQGTDGISSMGAFSAHIGKRQGESGAVVDGAVRDIANTRALPYPIWSSGPSPKTGKFRLESVELNGPVLIAGVHVRAGDLVLADDDGICFVPIERAETILHLAERRAVDERERAASIDLGMSVPDLAAWTTPSAEAG